jgi:transcriptional regulator with XRE-family HTH domain
LSIIVLNHFHKPLIACFSLVESNLKESFGKVLSQLRKEHSVSQQELADNCNIERAFISRMERAISQPTITIVFKIADYFEIKPSDLMEKIDVLRKKKGKK